ncbi:uncharacterized protein HMPREF1541_07961 [Cyphellophora europaea CBS 101466]|uniref:Enoyl reductase (ER) domain-containing protein n=1 Tax=Cyphellophora europaea (strain CBS 101466) TaxID=1220924 RepID=W2RMP9_CYPE1|nr:uncharacterized protein HMPREF1541_07961 [Cyphellophora europaea CBS 101466]ETN36973.1 hypothetical protein HMPREF1541_07961 [Cyphellophora europaea CBS 101466]
MDSTENRAAFIPAAKSTFEVRSAPLATPGAGQILVRNSAIAINPIDYKLQKLAIYPLNYPAILGEDVAGTVVSIGPGVARLKPGDRVIGCTAGFATKDDTEQAFQENTILREILACKIPTTATFDEAVVLPLAVTTASAALFNPDLLGLRLPHEPATASKTDQTLLVWGGAGSVGSAAIQLASAAGYEVVSTSSPKNFEHVKRLGASEVFDYSSPTVVADIVGALKSKAFAGAFDAYGGPASAPTASVVAQVEGRKVVATVARYHPEPPEGVSMKFTASLSTMDNGVALAIWQEFLPKALEAGSFKFAPEPLIAGHGLDGVQDALDKMGEGVSAKKLVVVL